MSDQVLARDLWFFRKKDRRPVEDLLWCSVSQVGGKLRVSIPVTSRAVDRHLGTGAYIDFPFYFDIFAGGASPLSAVIQYPYPDTGSSVFPGGSITGALPITSDGSRISNPPNLETGGQIILEGAWNQGPATTGLPLTLYFTYGTGGIGANPTGGIYGQAYVGADNFSNMQTTWLVGGNTTLNTFSPKNTIDVFTLDVSSGQGTVISNAAPAVFCPTCCVIASDRYYDRLLFTGGMTDWGNHQASSFIFDKDGSYIVVTDCPEAMTQAAAISMPVSNLVLVTGGIADLFNESKTSCFTYDTSVDTWTGFSNLVCPRRQHQMTYTTFEGNPSILVVGGNNGDHNAPYYGDGPMATGVGLDPTGIPLNTCEILNPEFVWQRTGSMSDARYDFGMITLPDGRILVCGGIGWNPSYPGFPESPRYEYELKSCEIYNPETGFWTPIASMSEPHSTCVCAYVPFANKVYVYGGFTSKKIEYLDLETMRWHTSTFELPQALFGASPLAMRNGFLALFGGANYDFTTDTFTLNFDTSPAARGSSFNSLVPNHLETKRYDGINGIWSVEYKNATYLLTKDQIGNMANTSVTVPDGTRAVLLNTGDTTQPTKLEDLETVGPFILDPEQPFTLSGPCILLGDGLVKGQSYSRISVASGGMSINECWLVFGFGYDYQVGPIRCLGHIDDQTLMIEPIKFPKNVPPQCQVNVLPNKGSYAPEQTTRGCWLTASNAGRAVAIDLINRISAAGIDLDITTRYPGDRGLGGEGAPVKQSSKLSDIVEVYGSDDVDAELAAARQEE